MEEMTPPRKRRCLLPKRNKHMVQIRTLVVVRERIGFIPTSNTTFLLVSFIVESSSRAQSVAQYAQKTNSESRTRGTWHKFHMRQNVRHSITADRSQSLGGPQGDWSSKILLKEFGTEQISGNFLLLILWASAGLPSWSRRHTMLKRLRCYQPWKEQEIPSGRERKLGQSYNLGPSESSQDLGWACSNVRQFDSEPQG